MTMSPEFCDYLLDLLAPLGPVRARPMFGGGGLYLADTMFAIVADDVLYLKADDGNRGDFEARGMDPFTYRRDGRKDPIAMSYWETPAEVLEDGDELCRWAQRAWEAARRSGGAKGARKKRPATP